MVFQVCKDVLGKCSTMSLSSEFKRIGPFEVFLEEEIVIIFISKLCSDLAV